VTDTVTDSLANRTPDDSDGKAEEDTEVTPVLLTLGDEDADSLTDIVTDKRALRLEFSIETDAVIVHGTDHDDNCDWDSEALEDGFPVSITDAEALSEFETDHDTDVDTLSEARVDTETEPSSDLLRVHVSEVVKLALSLPLELKLAVPV
jgi:hypothetical protein